MSTKQKFSSPLYSFVSKFSLLTVCLCLIAGGYEKGNIFHTVAIIAGIGFCATALIFLIFARKLTKPGDERTEKIVADAERICFNTFPLLLAIIFLIASISAEIKEVALNTYLSAQNCINIVAITYIVHLFAYGLLIYIPLKKADKNGIKDQN